MLGLCPLNSDNHPQVEFDEHVPVTLTWPAAHRLLDEPVYVTFTAGPTIVELKFHPSSRQVVEAVLVNAPDIQRLEDSLHPTSDDEFATACWPKGHGHRLHIDGPLSVAAYDDCLLLTFVTEAVERWVGSSPAFFGQDRSGSVVALCILWGASERDLVLGERIGP